MADSSNSNTPIPSTDAASRLYPNAQPPAAADQSKSSKTDTTPATPYVVTNMSSGKTIFFDPNSGESFEMESRNDVTSDSKAGADDPYSGRITGVEMGNLGASYGTAKIHTDDPRGRIIHGGGNSKNKELIPNPYAPRQGWLPTQGCTRGQNEDVEELAKRIQKFQTDHPKVPIMYYRVRPDE
ncbi:MAG TPA: L,D-transpeptidase family protein [Gallionellaceae bacterium]